MREYIKNLHRKEVAKTVDETYDYRVKTGIANHEIHPTEVTHVVKQAEEEGKKAKENGGIK